VKSIWGILVFGLTSSFFLMSSGFPAKVTKPEVLYLTTFGLVEIERLKASVTSLLPFFCSSSFALMSKNRFSVEEFSPVRSPCKLSRLIDTATTETEYWGFTADSSLIHHLSYFIFNFFTPIAWLTTVDNGGKQHYGLSEVL
jgi:hypothetical protein